MNSKMINIADIEILLVRIKIVFMKSLHEQCSFLKAAVPGVLQFEEEIAERITCSFHCKQFSTIIMASRTP